MNNKQIFDPGVQSGERVDSRLGSLNTKVFKAFEYFISMVCKGFQGFLNIIVQWFVMQIF